MVVVGDWQTQKSNGRVEVVKSEGKGGWKERERRVALRPAGVMTSLSRGVTSSSTSLFTIKIFRPDHEDTRDPF